MNYKELYQPAHTIIGKGCIQEIPKHIDTIAGKKALVVTDEGLYKIGTVKKVTDVLDRAGKPYALYTGVKPNPTVSLVNEAKAVYDREGCDYLIGIGGGSPLDVSKAVSILAKNGGKIEDYNGLDKSKKSGVPLIAINTTAGTGSEVTRAYVVTDEVRKVKMLMVDAHCLSYLALNDPALMVDMPAPLTAATGMDALTHAIEAYVAKSHFPFTDGLALEAVGLVGKSLQKACENGRDMDARTDMCWAEYMAGLAFSNAGLGMVHAMAHQLGGFYNTPHGVANAILLTYVMKYNLPSCKDRYADIARALKIDTSHMTPDQAANAAIDYIEKLAERIYIPKLSQTAFKPSDVLTLSLHALEDTGMPENPREATLVDVQKVFMDAYYAK
ncbi:iron-containing alcohol dehydrogenase [Blautia obeum]|uniref:Alcohol dehydrogenase 2 n=1 Tax=Blautia obeum TaxID=40520 RepID=A0A564U9Q5_9FIRM|nr:iron-containing alcohol dehydrogenase [Blautia obeum]VUX16304.1 Alcohol dehydrogenase 2 [Blautia obeum]